EARFDLYPDLGLAARRLRAHLQDERLADLVPFAPPTVRALEGWDVAPRGEDGVVLIRGDARVELVFDARGVVLSRREILDGTLTRELRFDGTKTQVSDTTAAASFVPRLEGYVVLDLPTRTAAFLSEKLQAAPASEKRFLQDQLYFSRLVTHEAPGPVPDERRGIFVLKLAAGWLTLDDAIAATKNHPVLGLYARAVLETSPQERLEAAGGVAKTPGFFGTMGRYVAAVTAIQEAVSKTPSDRHFAAERALTFARENPCALLVLALARHGAALPFYSTEDKLTLLRLYEAVPATSPLAAEAHFELAALFRQLIRYPDASRQEEVAYELAMKNGFFPLPPEGISSLDEQLLEKAVRWAANKPFLLVAIACSAPRSPQAEKAVALLQEPIGPRLREAIETALVPRLATETMTRTLLSHPSLA